MYSPESFEGLMYQKIGVRDTEILTNLQKREGPRTLTISCFRKNDNYAQINQNNLCV
jgi:hypothetical protein